MKAAFWRLRGGEPEGTIPLRKALPAALVAAAAVAGSYMMCAPGGPREAREAAAPQAPPEPVTESQAAAAAQDLDRTTRAQAAAAERELQRRQSDLDEQERQRELDAAAARLGPPEWAPAPGLGAGSPAAPTADLDPQAQLELEFELQRRRRQEDALRASPVAASVRRLAAAPAAQPAAVPPAQARPPGLEEAAPPPAAFAPPAAPAPAAAAPRAEARPDPGPGWEVADEGTILDAVLVTRIRGDFPGPAVAMVASPLWSRDRQRVLVPRGARALGTAAPVTGFGAARLAIAFHRLILPNGVRVDLEFQGLDQAGATGLQDRVNRHYLSTFGAAGALGVLAGLTQAGSRGPTAFDPGDPRFAAGQRLGQASQTVFERFLNRPPTLTIRAGHRLRIYFTADVALPRLAPPR